MAAGMPKKELWEHAVPYWIDTLFTPFAFGFVCVMSLVYEKPMENEDDVRLVVVKVDA